MADKVSVYTEDSHAFHSNIPVWNIIFFVWNIIDVGYCIHSIPLSQF